MVPDPGVTIAFEEPFLGREISNDDGKDDHRNALDEGEEESRDADQKADPRRDVPGGFADHGSAGRRPRPQNCSLVGRSASYGMVGLGLAGRATEVTPDSPLFMGAIMGGTGPIVKSLTNPDPAPRIARVVGKNAKGLAVRQNAGVQVADNNSLERVGSEQRKILDDQRRRYTGFYSKARWRWLLRDDCRYRRRRLLEVLEQLAVRTDRKHVFEIGFGSGDLLFAFPPSCVLMGVELSRDAVQAVESDPRMSRYAGHFFDVVGEDGTIPLPSRRSDIMLASHVLEHAESDEELLRPVIEDLQPGAVVVIFVPLEPAGFDPKHIRTYTLPGACSLLQRLGLTVMYSEENYSINAPVIRWMDHPSRHEWGWFTFLEGIRNVLLTAIPYRLKRVIEQVLIRIGTPPTQALVVARKT